MTLRAGDRKSCARAFGVDEDNSDIASELTIVSGIWELGGQKIGGILGRRQKHIIVLFLLESCDILY
jgi:hypothetical protein